MKKIIILLLLWHICIPLFANNELENIEFSAPTLEAVEYVYILEDDLQKSLKFLDDTERKIDNSTETDEKKIIRKFHLNILRAFAYRNHKADLSKKERKTAIKKVIVKNIDTYEYLIAQHSDYSGIYWMATLSFFLYGNTDFGGMRFLISHNDDALIYFQKAVELNPESPTPRIAYANFDSMAPSFVGADKMRGKQLIFEIMDEDWPKPFLFEYNISRLMSAVKNKDELRKDEALKILKSLYPNSWRIDATLQELE